MSCSSREKDSPGDFCGPVGNRGFCLKMPFFFCCCCGCLHFIPWTQSWQGHSELRHLEYPLLLEFSHCQREVSLSRRIWDSCSVVVISYSPICLKKGSKCKAVWVEWAFLVLLLLFFSQDLYPGMEEFFGWHFCLFPGCQKPAELMGGVSTTQPWEEVLGRVGWDVQIIPKKGWGKCLSGHQELLDEQLWLSWSSTGDPAQVIHPLLDCLWHKPTFSIETLGETLSDHHVKQGFWKCLQWDCAVTTKGCCSLWFTWNPLSNPWRESGTSRQWFPAHGRGVGNRFSFRPFQPSPFYHSEFLRARKPWH